MAYNHDEEGTGPQGTQAFTASEINILIADEIIKSQSEAASIPALIGLTAENAGSVFPLIYDKTTIGRSKENNLVLAAPGVSSNHAYIRKTPDGLKLMNLLSSNGTFVNEEKVSEKKLWRGDRIAFAEAEFIFAYIDESQDKTNSQSSNIALYLTLTTIAIFCITYFLMQYLT